MAATHLEVCRNYVSLPALDLDRLREARVLVDKAVKVSLHSRMCSNRSCVFRIAKPLFVCLLSVLSDA